VTEGFHFIIASGQVVGPTEPFVQSVPAAVSREGGAGRRLQQPGLALSSHLRVVMEDILCHLWKAAVLNRL
jgi:hypothetical protein